MLARELGRTGVWILEVGLGTAGYTGGALPLRRALDVGQVLIDTAESYGTEDVIGEAVRGMRARAFLATKVSPNHFRADDFRKSVEASLRRLGVDIIDLLQLHSPNPSIPIEETMGAFAALVDRGLVRYCGVSNFSVRQLKDAQRALGKYPVVSNQVRFSLIDRTAERDMLPYCQEQGITVIAHSPLGAGLDRVASHDPSGAVRELAHELRKTPAQILINWCLFKDGVIAIPKANTEARMLENFAASGWRLTPEQVQWLNSRVTFRQIGRLGSFVRERLPRPVKEMAESAVSSLPSVVRRRVLKMRD